MTDSTGTVRHVHGFRLDDKALAAFRTWRREHHGTTRGASWNWVGVFFRLAIDGKQLQVIEIAANAPLKDGPIPEADKAPVEEILGEKAPVPAKWFTGTLKEYYGARIGRTHRMENARVFHFKDGTLVKVEEGPDSEP
jgi:hypothetical protein